LVATRTGDDPWLPVARPGIARAVDALPWLETVGCPVTGCGPVDGTTAGRVSGSGPFDHWLDFGRKVVQRDLLHLGVVIYQAGFLEFGDVAVVERDLELVREGRVFAANADMVRATAFGLVDRVAGFPAGEFASEVGQRERPGFVPEYGEDVAASGVSQRLVHLIVVDVTGSDHFSCHYR
jgi:hypothetical protein